MAHLELKFNKRANIDLNVLGAAGQLKKRYPTLSARDKKEHDYLLDNMWKLSQEEFGERIIELENSTRPVVTQPAKSGLLSFFK